MDRVVELEYPVSLSRYDHKPCGETMFYLLRVNASASYPMGVLWLDANFQPAPANVYNKTCPCDGDVLIVDCTRVKVPVLKAFAMIARHELLKKLNSS